MRDPAVVERRATEIERDWPRGVAPSWSSIVRETVVVVLAFAAGAGAYIGTLKTEPVWPQDYFGAVGAGALTALAKMIPTGGGSRESR
jgi:hypothetical protein